MGLRSFYPFTDGFELILPWPLRRLSETKGYIRVIVARRGVVMVWFSCRWKVLLVFWVDHPVVDSFPEVVE
jgi:hypothetical protein